MLQIAPIVEGYGEIQALPVLLRRVLQHISPDLYVEPIRPIRIPRSKLIQPGELERAVELSARRTSADDAILLVIDADDDCPAVLAPSLLARARAARADRAILVVLPKTEFEAWFLAAATSLAGKRGIDTAIQPPSQPEEIRDAKGWLREHSRSDSPYRETIDQAALAEIVDINQARSSPSFDKLYRELVAFLRLRGLI